MINPWFGSDGREIRKQRGHLFHIKLPKCVSFALEVKGNQMSPKRRHRRRRGRPVPPVGGAQGAIAPWTPHTLVMCRGTAALGTEESLGKRVGGTAAGPEGTKALWALLGSL